MAGKITGAPNAMRGFGKAASMVAFGAPAQAAFEFYFRRKEHPDENMALSIGAAGATAAAWYLAPTVMFAKMGVDMAGAAGEAWAQYKKGYIDDYYANNNREGFGGNFQDTAIGATMRQRGVEAIANSKLNARSAFNGQARSLHQF